MAVKKEFDLMSLFNERSKELVVPDAPGEMDQQVYANDAVPSKTSIYNLVPSKNNKYGMREIESLKISIEAVGLLQPILVLEPDANNEMEIIAGHRRRLAILRIVNEGKKEFEQVDILIKKRKNDLMDRLAMHMANRFRGLTDWEKMNSALETEELAIQLKKEMNLPGRTRDILSQIAEESPTQLGRYKKINKNLCSELMQEFEKDAFGISVAYEVSMLPEEYQNKAIEIMQERGSLTLPDVQALKELKNRSLHLPGQENFDMEGHVEDEQDDDVFNKEALKKLTEQVNDYEKFKNSKCYSCQLFETCFLKKVDQESCYNYVSMEQPYSEKVNAETKKDTTPKEAVNDKEGHIKEVEPERLATESDVIKNIVISQAFMDEINHQGTRKHLVVKNQGYKVGEIVRLVVYINGRATRNMLKMEIRCMDDEFMTRGIKEGYCVIGLSMFDQDGDIVRNITEPE